MQDNYIAVPDGSGIVVIDALEPLYIDTSGTVYLAEDEITQVGQLMVGSIGRSFGKPFFLCRCPVMQHMPSCEQSCAVTEDFNMLNQGLGITAFVSIVYSITTQCRIAAIVA